MVWGLRMKSINITGIHWKVPIFMEGGVGGSWKTSRGECLKRRAWTVCSFRGGGLMKKRRWHFWGRIDIPVHTMNFVYGSPHILLSNLRLGKLGNIREISKLFAGSLLPSFPSRSKTLLIVTKHCRETDIKVLYPFHFCLISLLCPISFFPGFFTFTLKPYVDNFVT